MIDLDKLSYRAYGNLVIVVLLVMALLLNLFPFSLVEFIMCIAQIPLYLVVRGNLKEPIHAEGLNICFVLTILFYLLLFVCIKTVFFLCGSTFAFIFVSLLTILGCYATSTVPNKKEKLGKLFFGYKKHNESKYQKLIDYVKFNGIDITNSLFEMSNLSNIALLDHTYNNIKFINRNLLGTTFIDSYLDNIEFINCNLKYSNFSGTNLKYIKFNNCNLEDAIFNETKWKNLSFSDSNINNCEFQKTKLENLDLSDTEFTTLKIDSQKIKGLILNMNQALIIANLLGIKIKN